MKNESNVQANNQKIKTFSSLTNEDTENFSNIEKSHGSKDEKN